MNSLKLSQVFTGLTEKEVINIQCGKVEYGMDSVDYKVTINVIENKRINILSDTTLIGFFEQCLLNLKNSYNINMELYRESEKYYEISKSEILKRFNNQRIHANEIEEYV